MELFVFYIQVNKDHVFSMVKNETIDHSAFVKGLLGYFSECEFSGEEGAFYSKFKFRSGLMTILEKMWGEEAYRNITKELRKTEEFNRFVGHIITDLNYCMDEGFQKVPRYKELQASKGNPQRRAASGVLHHKKNHQVQLLDGQRHLEDT
jgi:hypothetical protein